MEGSQTRQISASQNEFIKELSFAIALLICPEAPTFHDCDTVPKEDVQSLDRLKNNLCSLAFFGNRETSIISESIILLSEKMPNSYWKISLIRSKKMSLTRSKLWTVKAFKFQLRG